MEDSVRYFISVYLQEFYDGEDESLELLCYEAVIKGVRYRTCASASADGENLEVECMLMKWDGEEWLARTETGWSQEPDNDFFGRK